jgi:large repetitive protein
MRKLSAFRLSAFLFILFFGRQAAQAACSFTVSAGADTTICANQTIFLNGSVTPGGTYTYQWTAGSGSISNPTSLTPTITPDTTTTYYLSVTGGGCTAVDSVLVTVSGVGLTVNAYPLDTIICPGQQVQLGANVNIQNCGLTLPCSSNLLSGVVGGGMTSQPGTAIQSPTLMGNFYKSSRNQMIYLQPELSTALGGASTIKTISFDLSGFNTNSILDNFTISVSCTSLDSLNTWDNNLTTVFGPASYTPLSGWNNIGLTTAFNWDGVSNLIVDVCWFDAGSFGNENNKAEVTQTMNSSYLYSGLNADQCGTTAAPQIVSILRPNIRFNYCVPDINTFNIAWSPATGPDSVSNPTIANPTVNPVNTTNYSVVVSDVQCAGSAALTVQVDTSTVHVAQKVINSCPGQQQTLSATVTGTVLPGPGYTLTWSTLAGGGSQTGNSIVVDPTVSTTYVVAMTGGACTKYDTTTVNIIGLDLTMDTVNVTCNGACNGKLYVSSSNGTSPFSYGWSPSVSNTDSATGLCPATQYNVTVQDANGCSGTGGGQVTQPPLLTASTDTVQEVSCANGSNGSLAALPAGGTTPYTYAWNNGLPPDSVLTGLIAATYTLTVTDNEQCTATTTAVITQPAPITFNPPFLQNTSCAGASTGIITVNPTGGNGNGIGSNYNYTWCCSEPGTETISGLPAGTYTVTVEDVLSCTGSASYTINQPNPIGFQNNIITNATCFGGSNGTAIINPFGGTPIPGANPYNILWTPSGQTTANATNLSAQTYIAQVTDDSNCVAYDTVTIQQPAQIQITAVITNATCNDSSTGEIMASVENGQEPFNYAWSSPVNAPDSADLYDLPPGPYIVTVTDANNCTGTNTFTVSQPPALGFNPPYISNVSCFGGDNGIITASPTGGTPPYDYNWLPSGDSSTIGQLYPGTYSLTVTDVNNCVDTISYIVSQPSSPLVLNAAAIDTVLCNGMAAGSITANVTGGTQPYGYLWSASPADTLATASNLAAGIYTVTVTDANSCTASQTDTLAQPQPLVPAAPTINSPACYGATGFVTLNISGGTPPYTYTGNGITWTNPETGLTAGSYAVVITDNNGCTTTQTIVLQQPDSLTADAIVQNVQCFGGADGNIQLVVDGGTPPYTYIWLPSNNETDSIDANLIAGTYSYTVTDSASCSVNGQEVISQPPPLSYTLDSTQVTCPGADDGTITIYATGGTPPYRYNATQGGSNFTFTPDSVISGLDTGYYEVQIADANGCTDTSNIYVPGPVPDSFNVIVDTVSCYGGTYDDGQIIITGLVTQNTPYQYSIDSGAYQYSRSFTGLAAGPHVINILNNFGCPSTIDTTVPQPQQAFVQVFPADTSVPLGESVQLSYTFTPYPPSAIISYNWIPSLGLSCVACGDPIATPYSPTNQYTLTISYTAIANGQICTASDSLMLTITNNEKIYVPNVFSPNGDGNNDLFLVYGDDIKSIQMVIFNRWGEKVFESTEQFNGWDGTYKGVMQGVGTYVYQAKITFLDNTELNKVGSVTLLR